MFPTQKHCRQCIGYFSFGIAQVHCFSLLAGVFTQNISVYSVLLDKSIVQAESGMLLVQIAFSLQLKEQKVLKRNEIAIRLIHTVRNINYLLSLVRAISVIMHKPLDMGSKKSSGFGLKTHCKAIRLAIHSKASE